MKCSKTFRWVAMVALGLVCIILGLIVEIISLWGIHPLAFVLFAFVGATLIGLGILVYLASLVFAVSPPRENRG
jgi:hypothetical protein